MSFASSVFLLGCIQVASPDGAVEGDFAHRFIIFIYKGSHSINNQTAGEVGNVVELEWTK